MSDGPADRAETTLATRVNSLANAALACGILQFGYLFYKPLALAGLAAIILGHMAMRQIRQSGERGYGQAKAGLILGYVVLTLNLLAVIALLAIGSSGPVLQSH